MLLVVHLVVGAVVVFIFGGKGDVPAGVIFSYFHTLAVAFLADVIVEVGVKITSAGRAKHMLTAQQCKDNRQPEWRTGAVQHILNAFEGQQKAARRLPAQAAQRATAPFWSRAGRGWGPRGRARRARG